MFVIIPAHYGLTTYLFYLSISLFNDVLIQWVFNIDAKYNQINENMFLIVIRTIKNLYL